MRYFLSITLFFFLSIAVVSAQEGFGYPVGGTTVHTNCYFNNTCASTTNQKHTGLDFKSVNGYPVYATATGKIQSIIQYGQNCNSSGTGCTDHGLGNTVIVAHRLRNGGVIYSQYSHLDQIATGISVGKVVSKGFQLGIMGATGQNCRTYWCAPSTTACDGSVGCGNTHLHFELKNSAVVGAPNGTSYWGYTPNEASTYGYSNPYTYLTNTTNSTYQVIPHPILNGYNSSTFTFDWTDVTGATNYRIQVRKANASGWSAENGFTNSITTSSDVVINTTTGTTSQYSTSSTILLPSTTYYWTIRVANSSTSAFYSPVQSFTTPATTTCSFPVNISSSNITSNSARINWQLNSANTNSITLDWSPNGTIWNTLNLPANYYYYDLNTLVPNSTYYYKLRRNCTTGGSSSYSSTYTFTTSPGIVNNGIYKLTRKGSNKVLDAASCGGAGANVQLWDDLNNDCQKWVFQRQSDGSYEIKTKYNTGLNLDVLNCLGAGANVRMWNDLSNNCQRWILEAQSDGSYEIKNKNNLALNLDAQSCGSWAGTNVQVWTDNNENCQRWILTYLGVAGSTSLRSTQENEAFTSDESKVSFEIIPNPTSGYIRLRLMDTNATGKITIQIHDLAGRLIETLYSGHADNLDSDTHYDTSRLHGGTYLVVFSYEQGREVKRLVVVR